MACDPILIGDRLVQNRIDPVPFISPENSFPGGRGIRDGYCFDGSTQALTRKPPGKRSISHSVPFFNRFVATTQPPRGPPELESCSDSTRNHKPCRFWRGFVTPRDFMSKKKVPIHHHTIWYYMGGVSLFLFIVQVISGILLLFYYRPGVETSYESMRFLLTKVNFGWLIRSFHSNLQYQ